MSNPVFHIKKDDTRPTIDIVVTQESDGSVLDLTGATATFSMKNKATGVVKINAQAATFPDASLGQVRYTLVAGDVDTEAIFLGEFTITLVGGGVFTIPHFGHIEIHIGGLIE